MSVPQEIAAETDPEVTIDEVALGCLKASRILLERAYSAMKQSTDKTTSSYGAQIEQYDSKLRAMEQAMTYKVDRAQKAQERENR